MTKNYVTPTEVGSYNLRNPIMLIPTLIPHFAIQVYYKGLFNEEDGLQPLLLLITINNFCNMYFHLQTSELLSGKAFNSISDILHFDVRNVSLIVTKSGKNKWTLNSKHFPKWACWANYCFQRTLKFHGLK